MGSQLTKLRKDKYDVQGSSSKLGVTEESKSFTTSSTTTTTTMTEQDVKKDYVLCGIDDLRDNEMKEFAVEGGRILLVKENGSFSALGAKCSHYGAPLAKGVLCNGVVRCPWHGACFNSKTGDIEDFPGLDSLAKFEVKVDSGRVKIIATKSEIDNSVRRKVLESRDSRNETTYVLVGAGPAAASCAETLRQEGFSGRIVMITKENALPYDRIKLSKALDSVLDKIILRNEQFYKTHGIEVMRGKEVTGINSATKTVTFRDQSALHYDKLMLATGGVPRRVDTPGSNLKNVVVLRTIEDANYIAQEALGKQVVILGLSFIGMESAGYLVGKAASVTVVGTPNLPFLPVVGEKIATRLRKFYEDKGVHISDAKTIQEFVGENGILKSVVLGDGTKIPADICLLGIGVSPGTQFLSGSDVNLSPESYVLVDKTMKTNVNDIYAAGDIVKFPLFLTGDQHSNVQHWQMALQQGHIAGLNMAGKTTQIHSVPFFWTMIFGVGLRYTGFGMGFDDVIIHGNLDELEFVAYYTKGNDVIAVATMKRDPIAAQFAELLRAGKKLTKAEVASDATGWLGRLHA